MRWPLHFCPDCGETLDPPAALSMALSHQACARCGAIHFRNPKPCAGVLPVHDGQVLLARRAGPPRAGTWDIVGGFLEPGEHPEDGARREALEETGLEMEIIGLVGLYMDAYDEHKGSSRGATGELGGGDEPRRRGTGPAATGGRHGGPAGSNWDLTLADITLNIYYEARPVAGTLVAADDVAELRWFDLDALPEDLAFPHEADVLATLRRRTMDTIQSDD